MNFLHLFWLSSLPLNDTYTPVTACLGYSIQIDDEGENTISYRALINFLHFLREAEEICLSLLTSLCRQMLGHEKLIHLFRLP